ncbi:MAG: type II secretion system protein [Gemmatimonadaceae bacterium]|nr:type II secretion system protein [Gemmatimonadaceae bacterium]
MTLLEAFVALVILGLAAVGYLDVFGSGARSAQQADDWQRLVAVAESAMEGAALGDARQAEEALDAGRSAGYAPRIAVQPWNADVSDVVVTVTSPRGTVFTLHRLVRRPTPARLP